MKKILVIGATGQIGSALMTKLRKEYGNDNVVAGYIEGVPLSDELKNGGPLEIADVTNAQQIAAIIDKYKIDSIYNLAAILSAQAEKRPLLAWNIQIGGVLNLLEISREKGCSLFTPSSIGAFGDSSPKMKTPQETIQRPRTIYGVSKVSCELLSDYYFYRYGVDTRSVRFPGLISYETLPGGGTTDYAVEIYYSRPSRARSSSSGQGGDIHGYDVHARCPESDGDADGGRPVQTETPQLVQHRIDELRSRNYLQRNQEILSRFRSRIPYRPRAATNSRFVARYARRFVRPCRMGLETRLRPRIDVDRHDRPLEKETP